MKYGLLMYDTENIGDEIQSLAARRFLPRVDYWFDRDDMDKTRVEEPVKVILNGWWTHKPENWPPRNPNIKPLLISMYVEQNLPWNNTPEAFNSDLSRNFLSSNGPVGARDLSTYDFFKKMGVDCYFSACLSLTLKPDDRISRKDFILAVDVSEEVYRVMKSRTKRPVIAINTNRMRELSRYEKFMLAKYYLYLYQSAHTVVTSRLHCLLPCLALGTPVLAIVKKERYRYKGLIELARSTSESSFIRNGKNFNLDNPKKNPTRYKDFQKSLAERCREFTGHDSGRSFLGEMSENELLNNVGLLGALTKSVSSGWLADLNREKIINEREAWAAEREAWAAEREAWKKQLFRERRDWKMREKELGNTLWQQKVRIDELSNLGLKDSARNLGKAGKRYLDRLVKRGS